MTPRRLRVGVAICGSDLVIELKERQNEANEDVISTKALISRQGVLENEVAVLITDMSHFSRRTEEMQPEQIRDFIIRYHKNLGRIIAMNPDDPIDFEPSAGDAAVVLFEAKPAEPGHEKCVRALQAAVRIAEAIMQKRLPETRVGIFVGNIIEARVARQTLKFGNSFAAASRLEELCHYFGTHILMDRDVAQAQTKDAEYIVSIGKLTPKNFLHPIHAYSIYLPGIHQLPHNIDKKVLLEYVKIKNQAMDFFSGNELKGIRPNFETARDKLRQAAELFVKIAGQEDQATLRILGFISEHPYPTEDFVREGMVIDAHKGDYRFGVRLLHLAQQLFKAMNCEFYQTLVVDTDWEQYFRLEWHEKGKSVIKIGEERDGVYYIEKGEAQVLNHKGKVIASLRSGDVFGEMAYFTEEGTRTASVVAVTDLVVRKILNEDFANFPTLQAIFKIIAQKRL